MRAAVQSAAPGRHQLLQRKAQMLEFFGRRRLTGVLALLVGAVGLLGMAQAAQAGTLSRTSGNVIKFVAAAGETNDIDIFQAGNSYYINDANQNFTDSGSGCQDFHASGYWYCGENIAGYEISLGDGNDRLLPNQYFPNCGCTSVPNRPVTVDGGAGSDSITGALVSDTITGGT